MKTKVVTAKAPSPALGPYPARETVCVKELPLGAKVEISMIAAK